MSLFENRSFTTGYFDRYSNGLGDTSVESLTDRFSGIFGAQDSYQINDNLIGNNAGILLTDDAQNTVNFLYINPIEFFNNGRASDIYLNISLGDDAGTDSEEQGSTTAENDTSDDGGESSGISSDPNQFNGNVIGNNAAILLTDDAQNTVNFLYVNPIEFFNNGRASDIYINISRGDGATSESVIPINDTPDDSESPTENSVEVSQSDDNVVGNEVASIFEEADFEFLEELGFSDEFSVSDALGIISEFEFPNPLGFLDDLLFQDEFNFPDTHTCGGVGSSSGNSSANQFNDNVIGNNAAILLTDDAQNTVNFLYINPIEFFNDGRAGDIYLNITLNQDDGFFVL